MAVQHPQHLALGLSAESRRHIVDLRQERALVQSFSTHSTATMPWPTAGSISRTEKSWAMRETMPMRSTRSRHHQRIGRADLAAVRTSLLIAAIELCDPRVGGAAKMDHCDLGE